MKIYNDIIQGTDEWHNVRRLKLTASHGTEIGNAGKGLITYVNDLVLREIAPQDPYVSKDMERGNLLEPIARTKYEFEKNVEVVEVGFVEHCENSGCSPDGLVGDDGMIEIKARNDAKHFALLRTQKLESGVLWQIQMQLLVCQRKWCDFISYNPNFKQSLFVQRIEVDKIKQEKLIHGIEVGKKMLLDLLKDPIVKHEFKQMDPIQIEMAS